MIKKISHLTFVQFFLSIGIVAAHESIVPRYIEAFKGNETFVVLGVVFFVALILEPFIFVYLLRQHGWPEKEKNDLMTTFIIAWVCHIVMTMIVMMMALELLGISFSDPNLVWWVALLPVVLVLKELVMLFAPMFFSDKKPQEHQSKIFQWFIDIGVTLIMVIFYLAFWDSLILTTEMNDGLGGKIFDSVIAGFIFLAFFLFPMRLFYFFYEKERGKVLFYISTIVAVVTAVWPILSN